MALITWKDAYSVNVASIDEQHKILIGLINKLHDAMSSGQGKAVRSTVLTELAAYTRTHFSYEESLMARAIYPNLTTHRTLHRDLVARISSLESRMETGASIAIETMTFLRNWLVEHIQQEDKGYSECLRNKGIS
jgi:hemerythrin